MILKKIGITDDNFHVLGAILSTVMALTIASTAFSIAFQEFISQKFNSADPYVIIDEAGILCAVFLLFFLPNMMHKYSSKYMLLAILFLMALCMILFDMTKVHEWSFIFPALIIVLTKLFFPITTIVIHHNLPDAIRSTFQGFYNVFFGLSLAVGPVFVNFFNTEKNVLYIFTAIVCFVCLVPILLLRTNLDGENKPVEVKNAPKQKWYENFLVLNKHPILYLILFSVAANGVIASLIVFVAKSYHLDALALNHTVEIFMIGGVVLSIPSGALADRFGIIRLFSGSLALAACVVGILALDAGSSGLNKAMFFLLGGAQSSLYLAMFSYFGRKFKGPELAQVNAGGGSILLASKLIFIQLYGWLLDGYGHEGLMCVVCGINFILFVAFLILTRGRDDTARLKVPV